LTALRGGDATNAEEPAPTTSTTLAALPHRCAPSPPPTHAMPAFLSSHINLRTRMTLAAPALCNLPGGDHAHLYQQPAYANCSCNY